MIYREASFLFKAISSVLKIFILKEILVINLLIYKLFFYCQIKNLYLLHDYCEWESLYCIVLVLGPNFMALICCKKPKLEIFPRSTLFQLPSFPSDSSFPTSIYLPYFLFVFSSWIFHLDKKNMCIENP